MLDAALLRHARSEEKILTEKSYYELMSLIESLRNNGFKSRRGIEFALDNNPTGNLKPNLTLAIQAVRSSRESLLTLFTPSDFTIGSEIVEFEARRSLKDYVSSTFALQSQAIDELETLLLKRIHGFESRKRMVLSLTVLAIAFSIYLFNGMFLSIENIISAMRRMTISMTHGDFSTQLAISSRDELATVATLFNSLAQRLSSSERFNRATLDALSAQVAVLEATGNIVATNRAYRDFAEANETSWQTVSEGSNYLTICDRAAATGDADAAAAARAIRQVLAGEHESWVHEYPCHSADEQRWFYCRVTKFPGEGAVHVAVAHENITAMKQAQEQLMVARARFETLDHVSPVAIMFFDSVGKCVDANDRWCEMSGIDREAALGDGWLLAVHPEDRAEVSHQWNQAARAGESSRSEVRVLRPNGEVMWLVSQAVPIWDEQGLVTGFARACIDITERKRMEQALRFLSTELAMLWGAAFYEAVARNLAELLKCEVAFICRSDPAEPEQLVTLAYFADGEIHSNFRYPVAGTPCEHVVDRRSCVIPNGVREKFPQDLFLLDHQLESYVGIPFIDKRGHLFGHLSVMSRQPLTDPETVETIAKLFAVSVVAEMERQTTERRFSDLFEFSPDSIVITNRDGLIVEANRQVENVFGWTPAELVGQPIEVLMPANLRAGHHGLRERYVQAALPRTMSSGRNELLGLRKDGSVFPVDISLSPMETPDGLLVAAFVRDVTARVKNEQQQRQQTRLAECGEMVGMALAEKGDLRSVLLSCTKAVVQYLDAAFARIWTLNAKEQVLELQASAGMYTHLDGPHARVPVGMFKIGLIAQEKQPHLTNDVCTDPRVDNHEWARREGLVAFAGYPLLVEDRMVGVLAMFSREPLTETTLNCLATVSNAIAQNIDRKHAETELANLNMTLEQKIVQRTAELTAANEELIQASRFKSDFLASMSHELRTPLNGVLGMNELLLKTPLTDRQREFIDASNTSGIALLSLINDVLDISKIEAGKLELDPRDCDLEALAYDVLAMFSHRAKQKGVSLTCQLDPESCVTVLCDDNRLRQVLVNLLSNALKFTATGSVILESNCVQCDEQRIVVRLAVTDTGLGIPDDKVNRLFSPFSQVDSSTTRQFGGTGLGLSIVKQLAELMGGTIGVKSSMGFGSTFWIEVPFELVRGEVRTDQRRQLLSGIKVLAVDGVDKERSQICVCLKSWGCPFLQVSTLREAVEAVAQAEAAGVPFAVILADCRLAIGDEFVHLQSLARRLELPVIGMGVSEANDLANHLHQLGLRHLLPDPVRPSDLFNSLTSVLSVTLPTASPNHKPEAAAEEQTTTFSGHILVAEDNRINQMFIRELLKHCGCTCDIANNGDEALTALQQNRYDLALMDCQMPEMDGFTATREIRRREAAGELPGRLPIIALTANAIKGDRERCLEAGMDDYLSKPLQGAQLHATFRKYLSLTSLPPMPTGEES